MHGDLVEWVVSQLRWVTRNLLLTHHEHRCVGSFIPVSPDFLFLLLQPASTLPPFPGDSASWCWDAVPSALPCRPSHPSLPAHLCSFLLATSQQKYCKRLPHWQHWTGMWVGRLNVIPVLHSASSRIILSPVAALLQEPLLLTCWGPWGTHLFGETTVLLTISLCLSAFSLSPSPFLSVPAVHRSTLYPGPYSHHTFLRSRVGTSNQITDTCATERRSDMDTKTDFKHDNSRCLDP